MSLFFVPSHRSAPGRYLVYARHPKHGERYLGVVARIGQKAWRQEHAGAKTPTFKTRKAAAEAMR